MKPGATLGLSHGFLLGVMQNDGVDFRDDINVVLNAPKVGTCLSVLHCMHTIYESMQCRCSNSNAALICSSRGSAYHKSNQ